MKIKIVINRPDIYIEAEATSEGERKELVKGILYTLEDITGQKVTKDEIEVYASDKQIAYMNRLGIEIPEGCTREQASQLINEKQNKKN